MFCNPNIIVKENGHNQRKNKMGEDSKVQLLQDQFLSSFFLRSGGEEFDPDYITGVEHAFPLRLSRTRVRTVRAATPKEPIYWAPRDT